MRSSSRTGLTASVLALGLLAACGDGTGPQGVTHAELLGGHEATTFTTDSVGITVDRLSQGSYLWIMLDADGSTIGRLFVPGGAADAGDLNAYLAGAFSFDESTSRVSFDQPVDTFVRDMSFTAGRRNGIVQLEARQSFGGTVVHVVLGRNVLTLTCGSGPGYWAC